MKNLLEFLPLAVFFIIYKKYDIITATIALVIVSLLSVLILTIKTKEIPKVPLFSALILGVFGFFTWYFNDPIFIKMKPTVINSIFAIVFLLGYFYKKPMLKYLFDKAFEMKNQAWLVLTLRWGIFFIILAIVNEIIWRNFSEEFWVSFKVFGFLPMTIIFTISQLPYMLRNQINSKTTN